MSELEKERNEHTLNSTTNLLTQLRIGKKNGNGRSLNSGSTNHARVVLFDEFKARQFEKPLLGIWLIKAVFSLSSPFEDE